MHDLAQSTQWHSGLHFDYKADFQPPATPQDIIRSNGRHFFGTEEPLGVSAKNGLVNT